MTWFFIWAALVVAIRAYAFPPESNVKYVGVKAVNTDGFMFVSFVEATAIILVIRILVWCF